MPLTLKSVMRLLAAFALLAGLLSAPLRAEVPARPEGPIADYADLLPAPQEAELDANLRAYNETTGRAIIVATVSSLDGQPIETYANDVAMEWGIGGEKSENGLLFLIAPNERELRIETARGLQGRMTDIMSGRVIRDIVVPRFKAGDMAGGIVAGVDGIIEQLDMDPADARAIEEAEAARRAAEGQAKGTSISGVIVWIVLIVVFMILFGRRSRGRRYRRGGGIDPWVVLWGVSEIARHSGGRSAGSFGGGGGFGSSGGGFGGFGGGGGFNGGGASGSW